MKQNFQSRYFTIFAYFIIFWCLGIRSADSNDAQDIKVLTYNVMADQFEVDKRIPPLLKILQESDADIIALQEVAPWFLDLLMKEPWLKKYHLPMNGNKSVLAHDLLILSKKPISNVLFEFLPSRQRRPILIIETKINDTVFRIGTCHLDSFLEDGKIRSEQLDIYFKILNQSENALFLGDFNFGDGEKPETDRIPKDFTDLWLTTNQNKEGYTWNMEKNIMAKKGSFPNETSRRIDRILIKSKFIKPVSSKIVGDSALDAAKELFPSDHFGLFGAMKLDPGT